MKKNIFFVTLLVMLCLANSNSWAQNQNPPITTEGEHVVVPGSSPSQSEVVKIVVERADLTKVKLGFGWSTNYWGGTPIGHPEQGSGAAFITASLPGTYSCTSQSAVGYMTVSYISDPWIGVDQAATTSSPHLSSFEGTVTAEEFVSLKLSSVFAGTTTQLYKNETLISSGQIDMQIIETGDYALLVKAGADSPANIVYFNVVITGNSSIENIEASKILKIYPNPASEYLIVSGSAAALGGAARVYNIHGQLQRVRNLGESPLRLDISGLPAGVYFLQVGGFRGKFVKE